MDLLGDYAEHIMPRPACWGRKYGGVVAQVKNMKVVGGLAGLIFGKDEEAWQDFTQRPLAADPAEAHRIVADHMKGCLARHDHSIGGADDYVDALDINESGDTGR